MQNATLIGFSENTTTSIDTGYDSRRLATIVSLYSHLEDGTKEFGIQSREAFNTTIKIPLGFSTLIDEETSYRISVGQFEGVNLHQVSVYIIDQLENEIINLSENDYVFSSSKGSFNNRFILQFQSELLGGITENMLNSVSLFPNPGNDKIYINTPNNLLLEAVTVYDITGRVMLHSNLDGSEGEKTIDISTLTSANYFVVLKSSDGTIIKRLIKK
jgi:hypothetical protein